MTTTSAKDINKVKNGFQKLDITDDNRSIIVAEHNDERLPVIISYVTPSMVEEAKTQLNETEETKQLCLAEMRKKIEADKKLLSPTNDLFLLAFLRARKYNVKRAFKLLQNYWSFRREYKKIFDLQEDDSVKDLILHNFLGLLLHRDKQGCAVYLLKVGLWNPEIDSYETLFQAITGILVYCLEHTATQIMGFRVIIDTRGMCWKQLKYLTPANMLLMIRSTQFCFPARYKGIHVLSENKMVNFLWRMVYPFLTSKLKKRVFFHGDDLSVLSEYIHPSVLPVEFGGQAPSFDNSSWEENINSRKSTMREHLKYGYKD